jgi:L-ribulose-5-phosphate 4-epimerase
MTLDELKYAVLDANLATIRHGLVIATFGNASAVHRESGHIVIKPSGVPYEQLQAEDMVLCDLDGTPLSNRYKPSSDLATHAVLYRAFPGVGAVIHTHSTFATIFAQSRMPLPPLGTTHADYFHGSIPVTRPLSDAEIAGDYVEATGRVIVEAFQGLDPMEIPAVLVSGHGPFVWGRDPEEAVLNAVVLEEVARMAWHALTIAPNAGSISQSLLDCHYQRKHGDNATYGQ